MNPLSMESIFMILSGVILFAGILYWLWSHIQLTQKKVQLLENAVFELRGLVGTRGPDLVAAPRASPFKDLDDDDWDEPEKIEEEVKAISTPIDNIGAETATGSTSLEELGISAGNVVIEREGHEEEEEVNQQEQVSDDLMPGGRIYAPPDEPPAVEQERFRELFVQSDASPSTPVAQSLDSMPVNELRRLAIQRGITGARDMRKKEILAALREGAAKPAVPMHVPEDGTREVNIADIIKGVEVKEVIGGAEETTEAEILE
jgi:hypothetical protein